MPHETLLCVGPKKWGWALIRTGIEEMIPGPGLTSFSAKYKCYHIRDCVYIASIVPASCNNTLCVLWALCQPSYTSLSAELSHSVTELSHSVTLMTPDT